MDNNLIIIDEKEIDQLKEENKISESIINGYKNKVDKLKEENKISESIINDLRNKYDELGYKFKNLEILLKSILTERFSRSFSNFKKSFLISFKLCISLF